MSDAFLALHMRLTPLLLATLAAVLLAPTAAAQMPSFSEPYQVRGALGNIPSTPAAEPAGAWNLEQRLTVQFDNASAETARTFHFAIPAGATLGNATCDCFQYHTTVRSDSLTFVIDPATPSGPRTITVVTSQRVDEAFGFTVRAAFEAPEERALILYVPTGSDLASSLEFTSPGLSTDGTATIQFARFTASDRMPLDAWFTIAPATQAPAPVSDGPSPWPWVLLGVGIVAGALAWSALVARGIVQKKSRKQVAGTAAHVEAAAQDSAPVLEGKKRALLAALKEVELAKQANEMPLDVYDAVKADLKKQAVTVMRALESSAAEPKA